MTVFIDIIGSWFVRISMIAIMLTLIVNMNDALYKRTTKANARGTLAVVDSIVYADLRAACSNIDGSVAGLDTTFKVANSQDLQFWADTSMSTASYRVRYFSTQDATTHLYSLYRSVNSGTSLLLGSKFTQASFRYYAADGTEITSPPYSNIRRVRVSIGSFIPNLGSPDSTFTSDFSVYPAHVF
jgi:hypothetical protein